MRTRARVLQSVAFLALAFAGCDDRRVSTEGEPLPLTAANLVGRWDREAELDGRRASLYVDSTFVFDSVGDTLFRYWFEVDDGGLLLDDGLGTTTRTGVEKLTADSLVLSGLPFTDRDLRFRRGT